jgi:hypothetical protein
VLIVSCSDCGERTETWKLGRAIELLAEHIVHGLVMLRSAEPVAGSCTWIYRP